MLMYLVLGCLMDAMAMIILTVPIIFPVITALGFDPIWFGVIIVMTVELGLIHPPVGMNVFVIKTVVKDVSFATIFYGVLPFVADGYRAAGDPDRVSGDRDVAAGADVERSVPSFFGRSARTSTRPLPIPCVAVWARLPNRCRAAPDPAVQAPAADNGLPSFIRSPLSADRPRLSASGTPSAK